MGHSYEVFFVFLPSLIVEKLRVTSKNDNFHYIRFTFFDITLNVSTTNDGRKTNNTSFEYPRRWLKNINFHYTKLIFFDITLNFSTTNDDRETNNTSYECPP